MNAVRIMRLATTMAAAMLLLLTQIVDAAATARTFTGEAFTVGSCAIQGRTIEVPSEEWGGWNVYQVKVYVDFAAEQDGNGHPTEVRLEHIIPNAQPQDFGVSVDICGTDFSQPCQLGTTTSYSSHPISGLNEQLPVENLDAFNGRSAAGRWGLIVFGEGCDSHHQPTVVNSWRVTLFMETN